MRMQPKDCCTLLIVSPLILIGINSSKQPKVQIFLGADSIYSIRGGFFSETLLEYCTTGIGRVLLLTYGRFEHMEAHVGHLLHA
jgi:hypothetical protein